MTLKSIARGLLFPEGPLWLSDGSLLVCEMFRSTITRIWPDGRREVVAALAGAPNGIAQGPDGRIYICDNGKSMYATLEHDGSPGLTWSGPERYRGGTISVLDLADGTVQVLYETVAGRRLESPNDIVFDAHGGFYLTDFGYMAGGRTPHCALYYGRPDGAALHEVCSDTFSPNGIGLSPAGDVLYWAETMPRRLMRATVTAPGVIDAASVRVLYQFAEGALDSLAVDRAGRVWVAVLGVGAIAVVSPQGALVAQYPIGDTATTNVCFGGADGSAVYVTAANTGQLVQLVMNDQQ
ncbi:MAG: hypothetical protein RLZZ297_1044 [Chloroflexota bacterium]|jgi:gluconolactonase